MNARTKRTERTGGAAGAARSQKRKRAPKREAEAVATVKMRTTPGRKEAWRRAAEIRGQSFTDWATGALDMIALVGEMLPVSLAEVGKWRG